jgi:hypothetical protein
MCGACSHASSPDALACRADGTGSPSFEDGNTFDGFISRALLR